MSDNTKEILSGDSDVAEDKIASLLLVDDDPLIIEGLGFVLRKQYNLITADSRPQAIEKINQSGTLPSLALIDLGLPPYPDTPQEGFKLLEEIVSLCPHTKVIVITGNAEEENAVRAVALGAADFCAKPIDLKLLNIISEWVVSGPG